MMSTLWLVSTLKLLAEVALMALLGRALLGALLQTRRGHSFAWRVLDAASLPPLWLARAVFGHAATGGRDTLWAMALSLVAWVVATGCKVHLVRACVAALARACA